MAEQEMKKQFKVFFDPSFYEFSKITGRVLKPDLPLFAQLYLLKETLSFYTYAYSTGYTPVLWGTMFTNMTYWIFMRMLLKKAHVNFFHPARSAIIFSIFYFAYEKIYIDSKMAHSYHININDLFDQDSRFLYASTGFKRMIRDVCLNHQSLVNQNYDLSNIIKDPSLIKKSVTENTDEQD